MVMNTDLVKSTKSRKRKFSSNISDPVADLLTRIRNANLAYKDELIAPISKLAESILKILQQEGYIDGKGRERTISGIKRISTPGRRVYAQRDKLPRVLGGLGIAIVSTSQGVMTDREASKKGIGGEVLAFVW
jgi:small subunit ribosomal protein S8